MSFTDNLENMVFPCFVTPDKLNEVLKKEYKVSNPNQTLDNILFQAQPEQTIDMMKATKLVEKTEEVDSIQSENLLELKEIKKEVLEKNNIEAWNVPASSKTKFEFEPAIIQSDMEYILSQIELNDTKIKYLETQLYILEQFKMVCLYKLPKPIQAKVISEYSKDILKQKVWSKTPFEELLEELPCKIKELKNLLEVVREYERAK